MNLISRQDAFALSPTFADYLTAVQDSLYNPSNDPYEPGEMYVDDSEEPRYVSQDEVDKWNAEEFAKYEAERDEYHGERREVLEELIFEGPEVPLPQYLEILSKSLEKLLEETGAKSLLFMLAYPTPWLSQKNKFPPVAKALEFLKSIGVSETFAGAIRVPKGKVHSFLPHLFWITRGNASLPYCYFSAEQSDFAANLCKFGNFHFYAYSESVRLNILSACEELTQKSDFHCYSNFVEADDANGMEGRELSLDD
jgi:hypothetical protein